MWELEPALEASFADIADAKNHPGYEINGVEITVGWDENRNARVYTLTQPQPNGDLMKTEFIVVAGNLDKVVVSRTDSDGATSGHSIDMRSQRVGIQPFSSVDS